MSTPLTEQLRSLISAVRFGQFASVGVIGALCDNFVLLTSSGLGVASAIAGLLGFPALAPEIAKALGIETAVIVMFLLNDSWTFASADGNGTSRPRRLLTSNLVRIGGITVQLVVFSVVYDAAQQTGIDLSMLSIDLWLLIASLCGIGLGMIINYVSESLITWRVHTTE
jgi:putative flippase GtrA